MLVFSRSSVVLSAALMSLPLSLTSFAAKKRFAHFDLTQPWVQSTTQLSTSAYQDPTPYLTSTLLRVPQGPILSLTAMTYEEQTKSSKPYKVYTPGDRLVMEVRHAVVLKEHRHPYGEIHAQGANYAFYKNGEDLAFVSTDARGFIYPFSQSLYSPKILGGSFFTDKNSDEVMVVNSSGAVIPTGFTLKNARVIGGNYYIDENNVLYTIQSDGVTKGSAIGIITKKEGYDVSRVHTGGGNFMVLTDGSVVTVSSVNGFYSLPYFPSSKPTYLGGNYFTSLDANGVENQLFTVAHDGVLYKAMDLKSKVVTRGYSFLILQDGTFVHIDGRGIARTNNLVRVNSTATRSLRVFRFMEPLEKKSIYLPNTSLNVLSN